MLLAGLFKDGVGGLELAGRFKVLWVVGMLQVVGRRTQGFQKRLGLVIATGCDRYVQTHR